MSRQYQTFKIADIVIGDRIRDTINEDTITSLMESIQRIGLRIAPTVREEPDESVSLVTGLHRIEACKRLGMEDVDCLLFYGTETEARLWECSENLHRSDMTVLEKNKHIAEWIKLTAEHDAAKAQVAPSRRTGGRPDQGINAAVRGLGIDRTTAQRAVKTASLAPEAEKAAKATGLDDNMSALLKAASAPTAAAQVEVIHQIAEHGSVAAAVRHAEGVDDDYNPEDEANEAKQEAFKKAFMDAVLALPGVYVDALLRREYDKDELSRKLEQTGYYNRTQWSRDVQECLDYRAGLSRREIESVKGLGWSKEWTFPCEPTDEQLNKLAVLLKAARKNIADWQQKHTPPVS